MFYKLNLKSADDIKYFNQKPAHCWQKKVAVLFSRFAGKKKVAVFYSHFAGKKRLLYSIPILLAKKRLLYYFPILLAKKGCCIIFPFCCGSYIIRFCSYSDPASFFPCKTYNQHANYDVNM